LEKLFPKFAIERKPKDCKEGQLRTFLDDLLTSHAEFLNKNSNIPLEAWHIPFLAGARTLYEKTHGGTHESRLPRAA